MAGNADWGDRASSASARLHVTNLSSLATTANVRQFFHAVADVVDVELVADANRGGRPSSAFVTMATASGAEAAVRKLHGRLFQDRSMMVVVTSERAPGSPRSTDTKPKASGVSVAQQYRERQGMVYELDCSGLRVTFRFSFQDNDSKVQRIEARATVGSEFVAEATAASRELALVAVADAWSRAGEGAAAPELDWAGVTTALKAVRAV